MDDEAAPDGVWREQRARALSAALSTPSAAQLVELQVSIMEGILEAEKYRQNRARKDPLVAEARAHSDRLRLIGDTLVWRTLDHHTIRNLAKAPGRPASIVGQASSLGPVADLARSIVENDLSVLICDTSNLLRNGDLVVVRPDGSIQIIECKASSSTSTSARSERQGVRRSRIAAYLTSGHSEDASLGGGVEGPLPPGPMVAIDGIVANYEFGLLQKAIRGTMSEGVGIESDGMQAVIASQDGLPLPDLPSDLMRIVDGQQPRLRFAEAGDMVGSPTRDHVPFTLWPIPYEARLAILEGHLHVVHLVQDAALLGVDERELGGELIFERIDDEAWYHVKSPTGEARAHPRFVGSVLYDWETPASVRARIAHGVRAAAVDDPLTLASPGPSVEGLLHVHQDHSGDS